MTPSDHPIFKRFPLNGEVALSTGSAPKPYHVYDGHGLVLVGHCDAAALMDGLAGQDVHPVLTEGGKGILVLFICDFAQASHGAHLEFHITALSAPKAGERLSDDPAAALAALATRKDWGVLSLHLWNDTSKVVAYNTEYLGLDAQPCSGRVEVTEGRLVFDFSVGDAKLISGSVRRNAKSDAGLMLRVIRQLGWSGLWDAMRRQPAEARVINRKSAPVPRNGRALTLTAPDTMVVTEVNSELDRIEFSEGPLASYAFSPRILEHVAPFRFVYLHPDDA